MLLDYIKSQVKMGLTVFFTTHIMEEAEYLCDEIAIINRGKIIAFDTPNGLKKRQDVNNIIELRVRDISAKSILPLMNETAFDSQVEIDGEHSFKIKSSNSQEFLIKIIEVFSKNNIQIESIAIKSPSLEEIFLNMVNNERQ
jgi:ABC-2 type transport system ATP-binding protein